MDARISTSIWRHAYPAIHRELTRDKGVGQTLELVYENRESGDKTGDKTDDARAKQSGHCPRTEEVVYGRLLMESPFHTASEREEFRKVSTNWHRMLGF